MRLITCLRAFPAKVSLCRHDRAGATSIEYAILAAGIALVLIAAVNGLGLIIKIDLVWTSYKLYWGS